MKRTASTAALAAAVLLGPIVVAGTAQAATYYPNCTAAEAAGVSNIHRGEPGYRPALDEDHDGVACEEHTGGSTGHHDPGSSSSTGSSSSSGSSSSHQVAVVPQGGAETGDGSTEGHPVWWIGGVLGASAAGLVGLARLRRRRLAARR